MVEMGKSEFKIKKCLAVLCTLLVCIALALPCAAEDAALEGVPCESYVVMDADTGQVLLERNPDAVKYPASITKIMTIALALDKAQGALDQNLTVSFDAVHQLEARSSHIALQEGEVVRLEDIIYATELESANDGANVLAEFFGGDGTIQSGVDVMNAKAAELGLSNTHYMNPHGLHNDEHYTTARDMANITRWALTVPGFEEVFCRNDPWSMAPTNIQPVERRFHNTDWMRISGAYYRDYAKGSKKGYHNQAKHTFVSYAEQDGIRLISVEMACPSGDEKFIAADMLLDYAFQHFRRVTLPAADETFQVDLVGGGESLGSVTVKPENTDLLLHDAFEPEDVKVEYEIPEQYLLGRPFAAKVMYHLGDNNLQPSDLGSRVMQVEGLPQVIQSNTFIPQRPLASEENSVGIAVAVGVSLLALLLVYHLQHRRNRRLTKSVHRKIGSGDWELLAQKPRPDAHPIYLGGERRKIGRRNTRSRRRSRTRYR